MSTSPPFSRPLTLGELLDRAFRLYRSHFATLALTSALFLIPFGIFSGLLTGQAAAGYFDFLQMLMVTPESEVASLPLESFAPAGYFIGIIMLVGLVGLVMQGIVNLALMSQSAAALHGESLSLGDGLRRGFQRFLPYVGMSLLKYISIGLVGFVGYLVVICVIFALALGGGFTFASLFEGSDPSGADVAAIAGLVLLFLCLGAVGIIALISPVLYLLARWLVTLPGLVVEEWGPVDALRNSWALTKGQVRRALLYGFLLYVLNLLVVAIPASIVQQVAIALAPPEWVMLVMGASAGVASLFTVLWQPLFIAAIALFYYDLRARQDEDASAQAPDPLAPSPQASLSDEFTTLSPRGHDRNEHDSPL